MSGQPAYTVHRIVDRVGEFYRVQWVGGSSSLEPVRRIRQDLTREGAEFLFEVCDRWVDEGRPGPFETLFNADGDTDGLTADDDNLCGFSALTHAVALLGERSAVTEDMVSSFIDNSRDHHNRDIFMGVTFRVLSAFVRYTNTRGSRINASLFARNQLTRSLTGPNQLDSYPLEEGVYVVGAFNRYQVGHCFALIVNTFSRVTFGGEHEVNHLAKATWIHNVSFVARVEMTSN